MNKFFTFATALILLSSVGNAAKANSNSKTTNTAAVTGTTTAMLPEIASTVTTVSMTELMRENQQLKMALLKAADEKETQDNQLGYLHNMFKTITGLYEVQLQKKDEDAKHQSDFTWMMHQVLINLSK